MMLALDRPNKQKRYQGGKMRISYGNEYYLKLTAMLIGVIIGIANGLTIGFSVGHYFAPVIYCTVISALLSFTLFKIEIIGSDEDQIFNSKQSKILSSNTWVFWLSSFLSTLIVSVIFEIGLLAAFFSFVLSHVWANLALIPFVIFFRNK
jgi:hypothetical protein